MKTDEQRLQTKPHTFFDTFINSRFVCCSFWFSTKISAAFAFLCFSFVLFCWHFVLFFKYQYSRLLGTLSNVFFLLWFIYSFWISIMTEIGNSIVVKKHSSKMGKEQPMCFNVMESLSPVNQFYFVSVSVLQFFIVICLFSLLCGKPVKSVNKSSNSISNVLRKIVFSLLFFNTLHDSFGSLNPLKDF